jgi:aminoglycoside phosphotransferase (APT) family kinase protein
VLAPALVAHEERTGVLYEQWLDVEACAYDDFGIAREAGVLLARLHADRAPVQHAAREHGLEGAVQLLATQPRLEARAHRLVRSPVPSGEPVWTHGDFHPDQLARSRRDGSLRVLDLDRLGAGRALDDLASWVADQLVEREGVELAEAAAELLASYAAAGGRVPAPEDLAAAVAYELVQRSAGALRRLERGAVVKAERLLGLARGIAPVGAVFA